RLSPTAHPPVPSELSSMWLVPEQSTKLGPALTNFVRGVRLLEEDNRAAAALPLVSDGALSTTPVADYARYYTGLALTKLARYAEADSVFSALASRQIDGHLPEDAAFRLAEIREAQKDYKGAVTVYESLVLKKLAQPHIAWLRLGLAADLAGQPMRSVEALQRAYYDYPTTPESDRAGEALDKQDVDLDAAFAPKELARAETLFQARRWAGAKASYDRVKSYVTGNDRDRVAIRIAATEIAIGRHREGRDALRPYLTGPLAEEANFHFVTATRGLKLKDEHIELSRAYVEKYPASPFAEEILNNLASAYIIDDQDEEADKVFRELLNRYPAGRFAERAAWKAGWWAYRQGQFTEAVQLFDKGAAQFPRSDYRPSWLYWSARAAQQAGDVETGVARMRLTATDYHNSYYGRLALKRLQGERGAVVPAMLQRQPSTSAPIPTGRRIASLLSVGLNREAMNELQYAQRVWGDSPQLQATIAITHKRLGNVRAGINAMKRAYPQYLAAGGETLPSEILQVIFPVDYWPLLQKYSKERSLDPFVVAALVAQESNFDPVVISHANAYGLMQVLPSTGRSYARKLGVRPFSAKRLTEVDVNVRIGTQIFSDTIRKFGGVHFALAAYNAGDSRVRAWQREKPDMPQDEFIDDIPFPETQNYVKRILGTAEDYRALYSAQ
ncbi:MAG TPA: transglycosylase SLT domain-containing protein, partial [Vicinamibacterales bacterium]